MKKEMFKYRGKADMKTREYSLVITALLLFCFLMATTWSKSSVWNPEQQDRLSAFLQAGSGQVSGRLYGQNEDGLAGAFVRLLNIDSTQISSDNGDWTGRVREDGTFHIDAVPAGDYYAYAMAKGYELLYYDNVTDFSRATLLSVSADSLVRNIDFRMIKTSAGQGCISGTVYNDADLHPLSAVGIGVYNADSGEYAGWTQTDENGCYVLSELKNGDYYVAARSREYLNQYYDRAASRNEATPVRVTEPDTTRDIDFYLERGGVISGTVTDHQGNPLQDIYVLAAPVEEDSLLDGGDRGSEIQSRYGKAITDEHGYYEISGLPNGEYLVLAENQGMPYSRAWYPDAAERREAQPVPVFAGEQTPNIDITLSLENVSGSIRGCVTTLQDEPVTDAYIHVESFRSAAEPVSAWGYAKTDAQGYYRVNGLQQGEYLVSVYVRNGRQNIHRWWPNTTDRTLAEPVRVDAEQSPDSINFRLPLTLSTALVSGLVTDINGSPLHNAGIQIRPAQNSTDDVREEIWAYANSDSNGFYRIDRLPAGDYYIHATCWQENAFGQQWWNRADSLAAATVIQLSEGERRQDIDFDISLRPVYGSIAGRILDEKSGNPVSRAYIEIKPDYYDRTMGPASICRFRPYHTISDEKGFFHVDWLYEGDYTLSVYANDCFQFYKDGIVMEEAEKIRVTGGERTEIEMSLEPRMEGNSSISGRVNAQQEQFPWEIAIITAKPSNSILVWPQSAMFYTAVTDRDGSYTLNPLPAGEYYVFCFAPWTIGEYYDGVFDPSKATLVEVGEDQSITRIDFELDPIRWMGAGRDLQPEAAQAGVTGVVTDQQDHPVEGANVYVLNESGQPVSFARTDAVGNYLVQGLFPGAYVIQVSDPGYKSKYNGQSDAFENAEPIFIGSGIANMDFNLAMTIPTGINNDPVQQPDAIELLGNYPNPFNPETVISFRLPQDQQVTLSIYNIRGNAVRRLYSGHLNSGEHSITWDGHNDNGLVAGSGVYIYHLQSGRKVLSGKMLLLR
ncbi:T9SS type A sorting domain-containing protein [candidate division KSB1 bacterium]|nr:T9SS type A sorting domain-containing protein [candidate division KSB1 bacterium]